MDNQGFEILSFNLKSCSSLNLAHNKGRDWLKKISAEVENIEPTYISAFHEKHYPSFLSRIYFTHIDPSYWKKRILLNFIQQNNETVINIKIFSIDKNISNIHNIEKWWFYWVYDLAEYMNSEINTIRLYATEDINQMKKEAIFYSRYKIIMLFINFVIGIMLLLSSPYTILSVMLGLAFTINALALGIDMFNMFKGINKKLSKYRGF